MSKVRSGTSVKSLVGEDFGPYRLIRRLGVGGMAETYEAIRTGPGGFLQHVCLKLVLPFFREDENFIELFQREARLAAKLRHSNIVGVIDYGEIENVPYMALELVDGADLRAVLESREAKMLPHRLVALLGSEIAAALEHAHAPSRRDGASSGDGTIVHRDVSPSNILISRHGEVFLSDFGVAKATSGTSRKQSAVKGKVPYMAPEQLRAEPLDGRADLFSLGVVMFEALSGQRPYEGEHDPATIMLTLAGDHPPLQELAPSAPRDLCSVIEELIAPNRDDRPETGAEVIDLLDEFTPSRPARRELGRIVESCRPSGPRISTEEALAMSPEESTGVQRTGSEVAPHSGTTPLGARRAPKPRPTRKGIVGFLAVLLIAGVAAALAWRPGVEGPTALGVEVDTDMVTSTPETSTPASPTADEAPAPPPTTEPSAVEPLATTASHPVRSDVAPRPARLTVIVFPWGNVWVNGKPFGSAPLKGHALKPGRYRVSAGQDEPFQTRTVRVRAGERKTVSFDLTE